MLKRTAFVLITLAVLSLGLLPSGATAQTPPPEASSLLVKLVSGLSANEQAAVIARNGGTETSAIPALRLHVVQVLTVELADTLARYEADPQVQHVEENRVRRSEMLSNDEHAVSQWALPQIGWDLAFGAVVPTGTAKVAILDTGIDATHPDLAGRVVPGTSILDGSNGLTDPNRHGTWVAGIVAANTNNAIGIAGVAFAGVQLMPVTVLDVNGEGRDSDVIAGVIWAADHGADVILMAFSNPGFSPNLQEAIDYAWSHGAVLVAAVGNDGVGTPTFPAGDRGVIGVSGTDQADALLGYSNYGKAAFLAAPGESIATTDLNGDYVAVSGTSSSAAIVAGVAAFLKAVDPAATNGMIVGRMARTADPAGTQEQTGNGRVNLARALADTGTDELQPAGADPVGDGGPFVGPYVAASGNFNYSPSQSLSASAGGPTVSFAQTVTAPKNNGSFTASLQVAGTGTNPIPASWVSTTSPTTLSFATGTNPPGGADDAKSWTVRFNVPSGTTTGTYTASIKANASIPGVGPGPGTAVTLNVSGTAPTSLTVSPGTGTYGGTVNLSATLTSSGSPVSGKTITFTLNGNTVGTASTNVSGVATLNGVSLSGINAGTYPSGVGASFAGDSGFQASSGTASLTVDKKDATWTTNPNSKVYGTTPDPSPLTTGSGTFLAADGVSATYSRAPGETVAGGPYHITATLSATVVGALDNYNITNAGADFTITKRDTSVTADSFTKNYCDPDPTFTVKSPDFLASDLGPTKITFSATRAAGSNAGSYVITPTANDNLTGLLNNYSVQYFMGTLTIDPLGFDGFLPPIGGIGGDFLNTVKTFKLGSTIPVKFTASCGGAPVLTGIHTLQAAKVNGATDSDTPIDATPTDAATTGNQFWLTDGQWHFNLSTKGGGWSQGTWKLIATTSDGTPHVVFITIKK
jgi:hypothetical protein